LNNINCCHYFCQELFSPYLIIVNAYHTQWLTENADTVFCCQDKHAAPTITGLMRALSGVDQSSWAEKTLGYEVRK